jgi:hypothetical protein
VRHQFQLVVVGHRLDPLPKTYAGSLRRREEVRKLYPTGNETP